MNILITIVLFAERLREPREKMNDLSVLRNYHVLLAKKFENGYWTTSSITRIWKYFKRTITGIYKIIFFEFCRYIEIFFVIYV